MVAACVRIRRGRLWSRLLDSHGVRGWRAGFRPARPVRQQEVHLSNLAVLGLPFMLMGGGLGSIGLYFWREGSDLRDCGVDARAVIRKKFRKPGDPYMFGIEN